MYQRSHENIGICERRRVFYSLPNSKAIRLLSQWDRNLYHVERKRTARVLSHKPEQKLDVVGISPPSSSTPNLWNSMLELCHDFLAIDSAMTCDSTGLTQYRASYLESIVPCSHETQHTKSLGSPDTISKVYLLASCLANQLSDKE